MPAWNDYSVKDATPADTDTLMIKDNAATGTPNKRLLFSKLFDYVMSKTYAFTQGTKSIPAAINELKTATETVENELADTADSLLYSAFKEKSALFRLKHAYINSSGKIVAVTSIGSQYDYDMMCFQVAYGNNIDSIVGETAFTYGFFVNKPELESVSYNSQRTSSGSATTVNNVSVPSGVNWIAIRCQSGGNVSLNKNTITFQMKSVISSGDLDDYTENGWYIHSAGAEVTHAPDTGGMLLVMKLSGTVMQYYFTNRVSNAGRIHVRTIVNGSASRWYKFYSDEVPNRFDVKIAFFGDSIIWGSIKTLTDGSFVTTQANPTIPDTMSEILKCNVDNYAVGGMGYITKASGQNILEKVKATTLTGYTHVLFSAGDNDSSVGLSGIGSYTDTGTDTIIGQMYQIITYLHTNYPDIKPIFIEKNNKIFTTVDGINKSFFGTFPDYYYGFTYGNGFSISKLHEEMKKFCDYYHVGYISQKNFCGGYNLSALVGEDGTHYTQSGYDSLGQYLAGQLRSYIG